MRRKDELVVPDRQHEILRGSIVEVLQPRCSLEWTRAAEPGPSLVLLLAMVTSRVPFWGTSGAESGTKCGLRAENETVKFGDTFIEERGTSLPVVLPVCVRN